VLERVGFDRAVERGGIRQLLARSRYEYPNISDIAKPDIHIHEEPWQTPQ